MKSHMTNLNRLLARQNFKDKKELEAFLNNLTGISLDDLSPMNLTPEEQAEDLVSEAYELSPAKAKKNIEKALELNPNCIEAYEYLASIAKKAEKVLEMLNKGIAIGWEKFGGKFLKENKGVFWGIHETRPFMRCLYHKTEMLVLEGKTAEGVAIMEEMLELNDHDNQGVRFPLLSALIILGETEKFKKLNKTFADDKYSASILYSRALFAFKTEGDSANARKMLKEAFEKNPYVAKMLLDADTPFTGVESYSLGTPEEAEVYLMYGIFAWYKTQGAIEWLWDTTEDFMRREKLQKEKR